MEHPEGRAEQLLIALEQIVAIDVAEVSPAFERAATLIAHVLGADKVDIFLYDAAQDSLVAQGTSNTPMGRRQHVVGLQRLPLAEGGRAGVVYQEGKSFLSGNAVDDQLEHRDVPEVLGVRSHMICPLDVAGQRRGVLMAASAEPNSFQEHDLAFLEAASCWVGTVMRLTESLEKVAKIAAERSRREAATVLIDALTPREREVALLVAEGASNADIARTLVITEGTTANHVRNILLKLGAPSRARVAALMAEDRIFRAERTEDET